MPSRSLNRRRFEAAADGHTGNCGRVAVFNGCNAALGQTGTFGQKGMRHKSWTGYAAIPRALRYSTGLRAPNEILIRCSLYQRMYASRACVNCSMLVVCQSRA